MDELQKVINQKSAGLVKNLNLKDIDNAAREITTTHQDMYNMVERLTNRMFHVVNDWEIKMLKLLKLDNDIKTLEEKVVQLDNVPQDDSDRLSGEFLNEQLKARFRLNELKHIYNIMKNEVEAYDEGVERYENLREYGNAYVSASEEGIELLKQQVLDVAPSLIRTVEAFAEGFDGKEAEKS